MTSIPKTRDIHIYLPEDAYRDLHARAIEEGRSVANMATVIVKRALSQRPVPRDADGQPMTLQGRSGTDARQTNMVRCGYPAFADVDRQGDQQFGHRAAPGVTRGYIRNQRQRLNVPLP